MRSISLSPLKVISVAVTLGIALTVAPAMGHDEPIQRQSPPRPLLIVEKEAEVTMTGGYAIISIQYSCPAQADLFIWGTLSQDNVVGHANDYRYKYLDCTGGIEEAQIIMTASGVGASRYRPGRGALDLSARICINDATYLGCRSTGKERFVQLEIDGHPLGLPI